MKKLIFLMSILVSQLSFAHIWHDQDVTMKPLVVEVVSGRCKPIGNKASKCFYTDSSLRVRLKVESGKGYSLIAESGFAVNNETSDDEILSRTVRALKNVSYDCPGRIYIDRKSMQILDIRLACEPQGISTMELNIGGISASGIRFYDSSYNKRLVYDYGNKTYTIQFNKAFNKTIQVPPSEVKKFESYILAAMSPCPVKIDYNAQTGTIIRMKSSCDFFASNDGEGGNRQ